uniref:Trafficking protein particle complex subunit 11 n=2 Tax=Parascaris TaxID=6254 RepID=A0A915CEK8_PARUN
MECEDIPESVASSRQQQLILFTGLDIANSSAHAAVFSTFTQNRAPDRAPLRMMLLSADNPMYAGSTHKGKSPKSSKGYIKIRWMRKYVREVPAVIVVFADLNWNHPSWNEKVTECESKISSLRASIGSRGTRICVVLLQDGGIVTGDDPFAAERASKLCQSCQLSPKQLFVFPLTDQLLGFVIRLESAFHELAQGFYQQCVKSIRARSIPNNFSNLIIRQQFKLAFISELRQDTHTALRHYKLAYQHCIESEPPDTELFEWRQVTALINYKVCQLSFLHSTALEAISQQRRHVAHMFASLPGVYPSVQLAAIEFALWKSKQCSMFADLFERAVTNGLAAMSTQHPGIHVHAAADHYRVANDLIEEMHASLSESVPYPNPDPFVPSSPPIFYGQRPWRIAVEGGNLADADTENNARIALEQRCKPNHLQCLSLLSSAMSQYKKYKCARMQRHMMLLMADEYSALTYHSKALQFTSHVLWECRIEGFTLPIPLLLTRSLLSAFFLADVKEFMSASVQMLNLNAFPVFAPIALHLTTNFDRIRRGLPPLPPLPSSELSEAQVSACQQQWAHVFAELVFFSLSAPRIDAFVRARASFLATELSVNAGSTLILKVSLCSCAPVMVGFERLRVNVSDATVTRSAERSSLFEFVTENVQLQPNVETNIYYEMTLDAAQFSETKLIMVSGLNLEMGSVHSSVYGTLDWEFTSLAMGIPECSYRSSMLDSRIGLPSVKVRPLEAAARLKGDLKGDALLGQIGNLSLRLICEENELPDSIRLEWYAEMTDDANRGALLFLTAQNKLADSDECVIDVAAVDTAKIPLEVPFTISYCAQAVGSLCIAVEVLFTRGGLTARRRFFIAVNSRPPFTIRTSLLTLNNEILESPFTETNFFARSDIESKAPLIIGDIQWRADANVHVEGDELRREFIQEEGERYAEGDVLSVCSCMRIVDSDDLEECSLGQISIKWATVDKPQSWVMSYLDAGVARPRRAPIVLNARVCTTQCIVRTAIPIVFCITNLHPQAIDLHITVEMADLFMFAGSKQVNVRLLSSESYECSISVMALTAGRLPFSRLQLRSSAFDSLLLDEIVCVSMPAALFVLPQAKE